MLLQMGTEDLQMGFLGVAIKVVWLAVAKTASRSTMFMTFVGAWQLGKETRRSCCHM